MLNSGMRAGGIRQGAAFRAKPTAVQAARMVAVRATAAQEQQYIPMPRNVQEQVDQCAQVAARAFQDGKKRQIIQLINPVNEKALNFLSTEAVDYPCSNMTEFESIINITKRLIQALLGEDAVTKLKRIDEGGIDGDLCAIVSSEGLEVACVVFPTAEKLKQIKQLAEDPRIKALYIVNPLWKTTGNLVSEFGIGPWRKANEDFVATFEPSYALFEQRIGAPSSINMASGNRYASGAVVRILRCYPDTFQVHVVAPDGASQAVGRFPTKPSYQQLEKMVEEARKAKLDIFRVAQVASSLSEGDAQRVAAANGLADEQEGREEVAFYSRDQILDMDAARLRRVLMKLDLPSSGTIQRLQARCLAVADAVAEGDDLEAAVKKAKKLR